MLADLLHHVRAELDSNQLRRTIAIYSANLHDESLAPSIQTMCAKLLLNLIDRIIKLPDLRDGMISSIFRANDSTCHATFNSGDFQSEI
jgi:transformation/transcription domain-associated protein